MGNKAHVVINMVSLGSQSTKTYQLMDQKVATNKESLVRRRDGK